MPSDKIEMNVSMADVPVIRNLIEVLTDVAEASVRVVESHEDENQGDEHLARRIRTLRDRIIALNEFVDAEIDE